MSNFAPYRSNVQRHYFLPLPELSVGHAVRPSILFQRRLDQNHVKLLSDGFQVEVLQITPKRDDSVLGVRD